VSDGGPTRVISRWAAASPRRIGGYTRLITDNSTAWGIQATPRRRERQARGGRVVTGRAGFFFKRGASGYGAAAPVRLWAHLAAKRRQLGREAGPCLDLFRELGPRHCKQHPRLFDSIVCLPGLAAAVFGQRAIGPRELIIAIRQEMTSGSLGHIEPKLAR